MQYEQSQNKPLSQASQSVEQSNRVKQTGGLDIENDAEHHPEASTMNTLSVENLSHSNLDHEAAEIVHKGWEKATDTIAQGVEIVKRIIMHELPPVEGENIKEKAENLKEIASEKIQEVKEKVEEKVESVKQDSQELGNKAAQKTSETQEQFRPEAGRFQDVKEKVEEKVESVKQDSQEFGYKAQEQFKPEGGAQRGTRTSQQTDLYRSNSGSSPSWEPTKQMKDVAREKLGEFKEKFQGEGAGRVEKKSSETNFQSQQSSFRPESQQESAVFIEQGKEKELSASSNNKIQEIEGLSLELSQKVEELKKSAALPNTSAASETIIIIQQEAPVAQQSQSQFVESQKTSAGPSQEQERPKLGHKGEQEWRNQEESSQEQQRPKLGHRGEQEWRNQEAPSQGNEGGENFTDKISRKTQELKEGYKQGFDKGFEKAGSHMPSEEQQHPKIGHRGEQEWRNQESEGGKGLGAKLGDKIKETVTEKATELKDAYQTNLQEVERKTEQRWTEQPKEHHESEHHLTTESRSFKPTPQSRSLLEHELLQSGQPSESHHETEHHLSKQSKSFQPSTQGKPSTKKEFEGQESQKSQGGKGGLEKKAGELKEKLGEAAEQIKEKVLPSGQEGQNKSFKDQIYNKVDEIAEKIMPLDEAEKQYNQSQSEKQHPKTAAPPAEIKETITYHPHDIRGYEIEYVPKHHEETEKSESKDKQGPSESKDKRGSSESKDKQRPVESKKKQGSSESKGKQGPSESKDKEESKPIKERIPFLDRVQHGVDKASHTYENVMGLFKPSEAGQGPISEETGYHAEHLRTGPPPTEIKENITYHPRDIRGYEIEYVPKGHEEGEDSQDSNQGQSKRKNSQVQAPPVEIKEAITYHPRDIKGYDIEYVPKSNEEGQHSAGQPSEGQGSEQKPEDKESEQKPEDNRVPLIDRVQHGLGSIKGFFHHEQAEKKEALLSKAPESSELKQILESQADVLKTKYSALKDDQPHGEELVKGDLGQKSQEGEEHESKGLFGKVAGALHTITDKFSHGASHVEGKAVEAKDKILQKEEPKKADSPREKIYEFNPKAKKAEEKPVQSEEKPSAGFVSRIGDTLSHSLEGVKEKIHHRREEPVEETSTEKNQSVFEKIQGKIQGKQTGEEVDKQGFKKVHDGFSESVDEFKHEQNEQFIEQVHTAHENPFEPLRTKQANLIDHPVTSTELVGGNLKQLTADFDENEQEMMPDDEEKKRGLMQRMKEGLLSKFGHGNKENEESS